MVADGMVQTKSPPAPSHYSKDLRRFETFNPILSSMDFPYFPHYPRNEYSGIDDTPRHATRDTALFSRRVTKPTMTILKSAKMGFEGKLSVS